MRFIGRKTSITRDGAFFESIPRHVSLHAFYDVVYNKLSSTWLRCAYEITCIKLNKIIEKSHSLWRSKQYQSMTRIFKKRSSDS